MNLEKLTQEIEELNKTRKEMAEKLMLQYKKMFHEVVKFIFIENPEIENFNWTQYTPHFNDGDICEFGVYNYNDSLEINGKSYYDYEEDEEKQKLFDKLEKILKKFDDNYYKEAFGDHCKVTVYKDKIEVEEYLHD